MANEEQPNLWVIQKIYDFEHGKLNTSQTKEFLDFLENIDANFMIECFLEYKKKFDL